MRKDKKSLLEKGRNSTMKNGKIVPFRKESLKEGSDTQTQKTQSVDLMKTPFLDIHTMFRGESAIMNVYMNVMDVAIGEQANNNPYLDIGAIELYILDFKRSIHTPDHLVEMALNAGVQNAYYDLDWFNFSRRKVAFITKFIVEKDDYLEMMDYGKYTVQSLLEFLARINVDFVCLDLDLKTDYEYTISEFKKAGFHRHGSTMYYNLKREYDLPVDAE